MRKLMMVAPYFPPHLEGMGVFAKNIGKNLKEMYDWEVVVVTSNHEQPHEYKEEKMDGMKIYRLPRWFKLSNTPINPLWYFQIKKIIKKENPIIIYGHTPVPFMADMALLAKGDKPMIVSYHVGSLYKERNFIFNLIIFFYKNIFERISLNKADVVLPVSSYVKNFLPKEVKSKTIVLSNSINKKDIVKKEWKNKANKLVFIGSLNKTHSWKGLDEIIFAIGKYNKKFEEKIRLDIVGDGDYLDHYKELVKEEKIWDKVKFLGIKYGREKNNIIRESSIVITYPRTSNDAFPTVILEAWANGTILMTSNIGPAPFIVKNNINGIIVKGNSTNDLVEQIKKIINNKKLQHKIIRNGIKNANKLTWEIQTSKLNEIIEKLI